VPPYSSQGPEGCADWPLHEEMFQHYSGMIETKYSLLTQCFGFIGGLNLPINVSGDEE
jgi:hypothetical protein